MDNPRGNSHILAIRVCTAGKGMVSSNSGIENWSRIGSRLTAHKRLKSKTIEHFTPV